MLNQFHDQHTTNTVGANAKQDESQDNPKHVVVEPEPTVAEERPQGTAAQAEIAIVEAVEEGDAVVMAHP